MSNGNLMIYEFHSVQQRKMIIWTNGRDFGDHAVSHLGSLVIVIYEVCTENAGIKISIFQLYSHDNKEWFHKSWREKDAQVQVPQINDKWNKCLYPWRLLMLYRKSQLISHSSCQTLDRGYGYHGNTPGAHPPQRVGVGVGGYMYNGRKSAAIVC